MEASLVARLFTQYKWKGVKWIKRNVSSCQHRLMESVTSSPSLSSSSSFLRSSQVSLQLKWNFWRNSNLLHACKVESTHILSSRIMWKRREIYVFNFTSAVMCALQSLVAWGAFFISPAFACWAKENSEWRMHTNTISSGYMIKCKKCISQLKTEFACASFHLDNPQLTVTIMQIPGW